MPLDYETQYLHTTEQGAWLATRLGILESGNYPSGYPIGFDTEFSGVDLGRQSTVARSVLHVASVAWPAPGGAIHPRGFPAPRAAVLSPDAVQGFRGVLESGVFIKAAHNSFVEVHTCQNAGIQLRNVVNTLTMARYTWPGRARGHGGFTLDALGAEFVGVGKSEGFRDIFTEAGTETVYRVKWVKGCACGEPKCRKRTLPDHAKHETEERVGTERAVEREIDMRDMVPGHPRWDRYVAYSARDAVLAFAIYHIARAQLAKTKREVPWLPITKTTTKPTNQSSSKTATPHVNPRGERSGYSGDSGGGISRS